MASELDRMRALYRQRQPRRVLEIGTWDGGTLREWLTYAPPRCHIVAIDPDHRNAEAYQQWQRPGTTLCTGSGYSQAPDMVTLMQEHAPYDWAFIDGDHGYVAVRTDVDNVLPLVRKRGVLLLHDITPPQGWGSYGPLDVFNELRNAGYRTDEYTVPERYPWSAGIGVVYL